jgi:hypothetical protein
MGKARDLARLSPNSSGQLPDANLLALAANKLSGVIPDANAPSGSVVQVVAGSVNAVTTSSTTWTDVGTVTITPSNASNRVFVMFSGHVRLGGGTSSRTMLGIRLLRNSTVITNTIDTTESFHISFSSGSIAEIDGSVTRFNFDAPNTTSAITYKVQLARGALGNSCSVFNETFGSSFIAMEVAG